MLLGNATAATEGASSTPRLHLPVASRPTALQGAMGLLVLVQPALLLLLRWRPEWDPRLTAPTFHFWAVSGATLMAAALAVVVLVSARSLRQGPALFVALGFAALAIVFSAHGLTTWPSKYHEAHPDFSGTLVSAWLSLAAASLFIGLGAFPFSQRQQAFLARYGRLLSLVVVALLVAYTVATVTVEYLWEWVPLQNPAFRLTLTCLALALFLAGAYRYWRIWWLIGLPVHGSMAVAMVLLAEAQVTMAITQLWHLSWWTYHVLMLVAFLVLFVSWYLEARRAGTLAVVAEGFSLQTALASLTPASLDGAARVLDALELKDHGTSGHVFRVHDFALAIARELRLPPEQLRRVALAGKLHDIGKIGTPDRILLKPGKLTPEEYRIIQAHAARGYRIANRVRVLREIAPIVRAHHERFDGTGYPDGLRGDEIPIEARIVAVADAFDAMTSHRPYRPPLPSEVALAELQRVAGSQLDPQCVAAFERALAHRSRPQAASSHNYEESDLWGGGGQFDSSRA